MNRNCLMKRLVLIGCLMIPISSAQANGILAHDMKGYTTAGDAACWLNPACSGPRGGDSDVMTIYDANGVIVSQAFAFGNEESNNVYYFDPNLIAVDDSMWGHYTTLLETDGSWSDTYGVAWFVQNIGGGAPIDVIWQSGPIPILPGFFALAFMSDDQDYIPPIGDNPFFVEQPSIPNPVPEPGEDSQFLTIAYDATSYLDEGLRNQGFTVDFRSDIPEPATLALIGLGLACLGFQRRKPATQV